MPIAQLLFDSRSRSATLAIALALAASPADAEPGRSFLASIAGIRLNKDQYVDRFSIDTWGVEFRAVCHLPPGWFVRTGKTAAPDGAIEGNASHGVTFLNASRLYQLTGLVLVRLHGPVQRRERRTASTWRPATFAGTAHIGTYGGEAERKQPLDWRNVTLTRAERCPPPR